MRRVRRFAGVGRRRTLQALQRVDPIRFTLSSGSPDLTIALICVYRARNADTVRALIGPESANLTVKLWCLDTEVPTDLKPLTVGTGSGSRFTLLNRLINAIPPELRGDCLVLADDDVRFVVGDLERLVVAARRSSLDVFQPAHSAKSYSNWSFVRRRAFTFSRRTDFVEQGPLVGMSARAQRVLLPLPEDLGMAWGVEVRWWSAALQHGLSQGIVDAIALQHLAPTAQHYDRTAQEHTLDRELRRKGLTDIRVLQQTLARTRWPSRRGNYPALKGVPTHRPAAPAPLDLQAQVSVVVPTYYRRDQALAVVGAVCDDPAVLEILVVVDGCTDDSYTALKAVADSVPKLRPIWQEHAGAGAARQNGLQHAKGDVVLFLDDDVLPERGLASGHLDAHRHTPGRLVVGTLPPERPRVRDVHSVVNELYADDYNVCCQDYVHNPESVLSHLWSGNLSLDRCHALAVGVGDRDFDSLFFEDRDFGLRVRAAGLTAVFRPDLSAVHHHAGRLSGYLRDSVRQGRALVLLHQRYPAEVTEPTARFIAGRFPAPVRWLLGAAQRSPDGVGLGATRVVLGLSYLAGLLHLWSAQRVLVVLLRRAGQARGVGISRREQGDQDTPAGA